MEAVVDKILKELKLFSAAPEAEGGISNIFDIEDYYFGDPGIIPEYNYPVFLVQPVRDTPTSETTGYEIRNLQILITLAIDAREFFDADSEDANGDRRLARAAALLRRWLRRTANRQLDGEAGQVREVGVTEVNYLPELRGNVITKTAQLTLTVIKQYPRQE